jgi:hypothetical protein
VCGDDVSRHSPRFGLPVTTEPLQPSSLQTLSRDKYKKMENIAPFLLIHFSSPSQFFISFSLLLLSV